MRLALAGGMLAVGWGAVTHAMALAALRTGGIERAYSLAPWDGRVKGLMAALLSQPGGQARDQRQARTLAVDALRIDPTAIGAVTTLGLDAAAHGDDAGARRAFLYANTLSRRDFRTQLWMVQDAVGRGNISEALRYYDIALRTSPEAPGLMFPVLAGAIAEPAVRQGLIATLARKPGWSEAFVDYVAGNGPDPRVNAAFLSGARRAGVAVPEASSAALIRTLIAKGMPGDAWTYYSAIRPGARRDTLRNPTFAGTNDSPSPFDWVPSNDQGVSTTLAGTASRGTFAFSVQMGFGGLLLEQAQMLPPGTYLLEGQSDGIDQPAASRPYWALVCAADGRELGRVDVPNVANRAGAFQGRLTVPAGCSFQSLRLMARATDAAAGISGEITEVRLRAVGAAPAAK